MPHPTPSAIAKALDAHRERNAEAHEDLVVYANCVADELARLQAEDAELAPGDLETIFADPPEYDCPDTMGIVHFMLGYVQCAAAFVGVAAADLVRRLTGK